MASASGRSDDGAKKRVAENAPAEEPISKRLGVALQKHGLEPSKSTEIIKIFQHPLAANFPEGTCNMLLAALPDSLCVLPGERHEYQEAVLKIMSEVLEQICATMHASVEAEIAELAKLMVEKRSFEWKVESAVIGWSKAQAATTESHAQYTVATRAHEAAYQKFTKAKETKKAGEDAEACIKNDMDALTDLLRAICNHNSHTTPMTKTHYETRVEPIMLFKLDIEPSLCHTVASAFFVTEAGSLEKDVLLLLEGKIVTKFSELSKRWDDSKGKGGKHRKQVEAASDEWTQASKEAARACEAASAAKISQEQANSHAARAKNTLAQHEVRFNMAQNRLGQKQQELETFIRSNMHTFGTLANGFQPL